MGWSLALCPDDEKQDPVVYGAEFGVVCVHILHPYRSIHAPSFVEADRRG